MGIQHFPNGSSLCRLQCSEQLVIFYKNINDQLELCRKKGSLYSCKKMKHLNSEPTLACTLLDMTIQCTMIVNRIDIQDFFAYFTTEKMWNDGITVHSFQTTQDRVHLEVFVTFTWLDSYNLKVIIVFGDCFWLQILKMNCSNIISLLLRSYRVLFFYPIMDFIR